MLALRPIARLSRTSLHLQIARFSAPRFQRTMASSTTPLPEWLVIVPDHTGMLAKRLEVRPMHLTNLKNDRPDMITWGGSTLDEQITPGDTNPPKSNGSAMVIGASTKEEVLERLKKDIYTEAGVWDVSKVQIFPFRTAIRKAM